MKLNMPITIRYAETDKMAVVYHANYLLYFEDARTKFLEELGYPYTKIEAQGLLSPVVSFEVNYGTPLQYGDVAIIRTWICESKPTKTTYAYEVYKQGQDIKTTKPCCTAKSVHCLVDAETFKPKSIKRETPELYELYEKVCVREGQ